MTIFYQFDPTLNVKEAGLLVVCCLPLERDQDASLTLMQNIDGSHVPKNVAVIITVHFMCRNRKF